MLEPFLCGWFSPAPLIPKLRGCFAEFLNNASPAGLRILSLSTCVGLWYGSWVHNSGFSWHMAHRLRYLNFAPHHVFGLTSLLFLSPPTLAPVFPFPAPAFHMRPRFSDTYECRDINLLPIDYASLPRLRPRLTQGRSALPWNPWISGLDDSHIHLATHSGILSRILSTALYQYSFAVYTMLPYRCTCVHPQASVTCFSPGHFRRRTSRLVSYYALFECMAASEPTS